MSDLMMETHREAMKLVDRASHLRRRGKAEQAGAVLRKAFEQERRAAELSAPDRAAEPTRSVLHRSAATLAFQCGEYREAERLIAAPLAGNPPDAIADELRDLLEQVYFERPRKKGRRPLKPSDGGGGGYSESEDIR